MKTFQFNVSTFHQWNYFISKKERERREFVEKLNYASIPTTFHGSFVIRSRKDLPGISIPFALCLSRTNGADFRASRSRKEKKLKKTNPWIEVEERGDDLPRIPNHHPPFVPGPFSASSARLSQQVHPWCRALLLFFFFSSFYPSTLSNDRSSRGKRRSPSVVLIEAQKLLG